MINMEMNLLKQCKNFKRILNNVMSKNNFYVKLINNFLKQSDVKQNHYNVNDDNNISYKYLCQISYKEEDYEKIIKVIDSCVTEDQFESARVLIYNYFNNINNDINLFNKLLNFWEYKFRKLYYNE